MDCVAAPISSLGLTAIVANAANDGWAATTEGGLRSGFLEPPQAGAQGVQGGVVAVDLLLKVNVVADQGEQKEHRRRRR